MYSAFGVDHHGEEIAKKGEKLATRIRPLTQRGVDSLRTAAKETLSNPENKNVTLREAKTPFLNAMSDQSRFHGAIETARQTSAKTSRAAEHNRAIERSNKWLGEFKKGPTKAKPQSTALVDNMTIGDVNRAAEIRRIDVSPENVFRGKKKTTTSTNALTGQTKQHVQREGNRFLKPKDVISIGGEKYVNNGKGGGLTDAGKVTFVGGPAAAAGLGGMAMNEKAKRSSY